MTNSIKKILYRGYGYCEFCDFTGYDYEDFFISQVMVMKIFKGFWLWI